MLSSRASSLRSRLTDEGTCWISLYRTAAIGGERSARRSFVPPVDDAHQVAVLVGPHQQRPAVVAPRRDRLAHYRRIEELRIARVDGPADGRQAGVLVHARLEPADVDIEAGCQAAVQGRHLEGVELEIDGQDAVLGEVPEIDGERFPGHQMHGR